MSRMPLPMILVALVARSLTAQECPLSADERSARLSNFPYEGIRVLQELGVWDRYEADVAHLNPFYLRGDFDGDGKTDFVSRLIARDDSSQARLAVIFGRGSVVWLERDDRLRFPTVSGWHVRSGYLKIYQSPYEDRPPPEPAGDVIVLENLEASGSFVYWNGERFVSYWVGD